MPIAAATYIKDMTLLVRDRLITGVTDPLSRSVGFVMTSYPKRDVRYPVITVKTLGMADTVRLGLRSEEMWTRVPMEIRVWARNVEERDSLAQSAQNVLRTIQLDATTGTVANDMFGFKISSTVDVDEDSGDAGGLSVKSKVIDIQYQIVLA